MIIEQDGFIDRILADIKENEITPDLLQLEVTESQFLGNSKPLSEEEFERFLKEKT